MLDGKYLNLKKLYLYNEINLFFINLIVVSLLFVNARMRLDFMNFFINSDDSLFFVFFIIGFIAVFYLALFKNSGRQWKSLAGIYIILINIFIGVETIGYLDQVGGDFFQYLFPRVNTSLALIMAVAIRSNFIEPEELITDKQAKSIELLIGLLLIPLLVFYSTSLLNNHWTVTFSICLFYVNFINRLLFGLYQKSKEGLAV